MTKTPSYLKGLAETRALAAGDNARISRLRERVGERAKEIEEKFQNLTRERADLEDLQERVAERLEVSRMDLQACDKLITKFDARLDPDEIAPIGPWQGRYGRRGGPATGGSCTTTIRNAGDDNYFCRLVAAG